MVIFSLLLIHTLTLKATAFEINRQTVVLDNYNPDVNAFALLARIPYSNTTVEAGDEDIGTNGDEQLALESSDEHISTRADSSQLSLGLSN